MDLDLIILWHFHQPYYGLPGATGFELPWVRLHAAKSYLDMGETLRRFPEVRATANFSGALLEQIERYVHHGWRDRSWDLTTCPATDLSESDYRYLVGHFFSFDWRCVLSRFPRLGELLDRRGRGRDPAGWARLTPAEVTDLQVLFNLAWCGFTLRHSDERVAELVDKGASYTEGDKAIVLAAHRDALERIVPLWTELAERGQVELSVSPHYHPILPLLINSDSARRALAGHPMPVRFRHPGDAQRQIEMALELAERLFGRRPTGLWPSEGSVSPELLPIVARCGLKWMASDEEVLLQSRRSGSGGRRDIYEPWLTGVDGPATFFRDHELSDLVGFSYARTAPDVAARDLCDRLSAIAAKDTASRRCVSIILDGENAWEHYDDDGRPFLEAFYEGLTRLPGVSTTTPAERLAEAPPTRQIDRLHTGSWIFANFRIWIGTAETNLAWNHLHAARGFFADRLTVDGRLSEARVNEALTYLLRAEGSDWFWWYGDDFVSNDDELFDRLFRDNLKAVYRALDAPHPAALDYPIRVDDLSTRTKPPRSLIHPVVDGRVGGYLEWLEAGVYNPRTGTGAMAQSGQYAMALYFGFDLDHLYLRLDTTPDIWPSAQDPFHFVLDLRIRARGLHVEVDLPFEQVGALEPRTLAVGGQLAPPNPVREAYLIDCLELSVSFAALEAQPGELLELALRVVRRGVALQSFPQGTMLEIRVPDASFEGRNWLV